MPKGAAPPSGSWQAHAMTVSARKVRRQLNSAVPSIHCNRCSSQCVCVSPAPEVSPELEWVVTDRYSGCGLHAPRREEIEGGGPLPSGLVVAVAAAAVAG